MSMRRFRFLKRIGRQTKGAAGIEFAIIAPVFLLWISAIFEIGLIFFAQQTLLHGVNVTSRQVRTGQAHSENLSQSDFRADVCAQVGYILSCDADKLFLDVRSFSSFGGVGFPAPLDGDGNFDNVNMNQWNIGVSGSISGGSSIVLVRAFYVWPLFTPYVSYFFANMAGDYRLVSASVAFKNEPF
jgi:Flp pilus assembly protein TadG